MAFFNFTIPDDAEPMRLDVFLAAELPQYSREFLKKCRLKINEEQVKPNKKVVAGDRVWVGVPALKSLVIEPEDIPLEVIFEDDDILVINKAAGMVVHPTDHGGHVTGTLVNAVLHHLQIPASEDRRPGLVHRLDKDTSGLMVIAKTEEAKAHLTEQFSTRTVSKTYTALVAGAMADDSGRIEAPIGRGAVDRTRREISTRPDAREAITEFDVVERFVVSTGPKIGAATLVNVRILTGRTHQIRVHMTSLGHPVVGDVMYGHKKMNATFGDPRQLLHASELALRHPATGEEMTFTAPLPADFEKALAELRERQ